jgi:hypothetical protein
MGRCTEILTAMMGGKKWSWRVVGITPAALKFLQSAGYKKVARDGVTRAHIQSRSQTTIELLQPEVPLSRSAFAEVWMKNDQTVLCVRGENRTILPPYISFADPEHALFQSTRVAWRHRKEERNFLSTLAKENELDDEII